MHYAMRSLLLLGAVVASVYSMCAPGTPIEKCNDIIRPSPKDTASGKDSTEISEELFLRAVSESWYGNPTDEQYKTFQSSAVEKGNVTTRTELAMLLANIIHESDGLRALKEGGPPYIPTDKDPAHPERSYHGRGYLMLRGYENYKNASLGLYGDERLAENPDSVQNDTTAWDTAFWFWANKIHGQPGVSEGDFGVSLGILSNKRDCANMNRHQRFRIYQSVLQVLIPGQSAVATNC